MTAAISPSVGIAATVPILHIEPFWSGRESALLDVIGRFHPGADGNFTPHFNEAALRASLIDAVPSLAELSARAINLLETGYPALILSGIADAANGVDSRQARARLYALALAFGYPTPSDQQSGCLLWSVRAKPAPVGRSATYSEHQLEADLHSDSQYYPEPERIGILYAVRSAGCGGGRSILCDGPAIRSALRSTKQGREALALLHEPIFPFPMYDPFFATTNWESAAGPVPVVRRAILAEEPGPQIRFRRDVIAAGFALAPSDSDQAAKRALAVLDSAIAQAPKRELLIPDGSALLWDNYATLHGRTAFSDPERHLLRVRISTRSVAEQVSSFDAANLIGSARPDR